MPQKLEGLELGTTQALGAQQRADGGIELEQVVQPRGGAGLRRDSGRDPLDVIDHRIAEAGALIRMVSRGDRARDPGFYGPSLTLQLHFDLLASLKLLTELTTLAASVATAAICVDDGLDGSACTALASVSTDDCTALVSLGKSPLAELTSDVASLLIVVICDFRPLRPLLEVTLGRSFIEFSRSVRSEQYAGLLLPQPASATARRRDHRHRRHQL